MRGAGNNHGRHRRATWAVIPIEEVIQCVSRKDGKLKHMTLNSGRSATSFHVPVRTYSVKQPFAGLLSPSSHRLTQDRAGRELLHLETLYPSRRTELGP